MTAPLDADLLARQAAALIGLEVPEPCRAGVAHNLLILAGHAARLLDFGMPTDVEAAPEFRP